MSKSKKKLLKPKKKGPTKKQLQARITTLQRVLTASLNREVELEQQLKVGDSLRKIGEHWYELKETFDPKQIKRVQVGTMKQPSFMMGLLRDIIVIEVPDMSNMEELVQFQRALVKQGIDNKVLFVQKGVQFLKIAPVDADVERELDAREMEYAEEAQVPSLAGPDSFARSRPSSVGPKFTRDGLDDSRLATEQSDSDGGDRDEASEQGGKEASDGVRKESA